MLDTASDDLSIMRKLSFSCGASDAEKLRSTTATSIWRKLAKDFKAEMTSQEWLTDEESATSDVESVFSSAGRELQRNCSERSEDTLYINRQKPIRRPKSIEFEFRTLLDLLWAPGAVFNVWYGSDSSAMCRSHLLSGRKFGLDKVIL